MGDLLDQCTHHFPSIDDDTSYQFCILSTDKTNIGTFSIEEKTRFKYNTLINLKFISAGDKEKLKFLSTQLKEFKTRNAELTEDRDKKRTTLENINEEYRRMKNESESMVLKINQQSKFIEDTSKSLDEFKKENHVLKQRYDNETQQLKTDLDSTTKNRNELAENKLLIESDNKEMRRTIETLTKENQSMDSEMNRLLESNKELYEKRYANENLSRELKDKIKTIEDKEKIVDSQSTYIKQLEGELKTVKANFAKQNKKLQESVEQINYGNKVIKEIRKDRKELKTKYKECSTKLKEVEDYLHKTEGSLTL